VVLANNNNHTFLPGDIPMSVLRKVLAASLMVAGFSCMGQATADGANGSTYILQSFDGTSDLMGLNDQGHYFQGFYDSTTNFKQAALDKFIPTDPCRTLSENYNSYIAVNDTVGFNSTLSGMANFSCKAKVLVDKFGIIKSFQPAP
jgi:hypothetical protein